MNWEALGAVGEIVGAVAVIATLGYLAVQMRQNTRALRTSSYHQAVEQGWMANITIADNPELADIMTRGARDLSTLNPEERARFGYAMSNECFSMENALHLYEQGMLHEEAWENVLANGLFLFSQPGVLRFMSRRPGPLAARLHALVNERATTKERESAS